MKCEISLSDVDLDPDHGLFRAEVFASDEFVRTELVLYNKSFIKTAIFKRDNMYYCVKY